jgi:hypothetical protein
MGEILEIKEPDLKSHAFLHICMSPAILNDNEGILDSPDPSGSHISKFIVIYPMLKIPYLSNKLTHSGSCLKGRSGIINTGRITVQVRRACWIFRIEPSGMKYFCGKTSFPSPAFVGALNSGAYSDKGRVPIASPRASQRSAETRPTEYGCVCPGWGPVASSRI